MSTNYRTIEESMSRDIFVQDLPTDVNTVDQIPDDWMPDPLPYDRAAVVAAVARIAPHAVGGGLELMIIDFAESSVEVSIPGESPLMSFGLHLRGNGGEAVDFASALLAALESRAFDTESPTGIFSR